MAAVRGSDVAWGRGGGGGRRFRRRAGLPRPRGRPRVGTPWRPSSRERVACGGAAEQRQEGVGFASRGGRTAL